MQHNLLRPFSVFNPFNPNPYYSRGTKSAVLGLAPTIVVFHILFSVA